MKSTLPMRACNSVVNINSDNNNLINKDFLKQVHRKKNASNYVSTTSCGRYQQTGWFLQAKNLKVF